MVYRKRLSNVDSSNGGAESLWALLLYEMLRANCIVMRLDIYECLSVHFAKFLSLFYCHSTMPNDFNSFCFVHTYLLLQLLGLY